MRGRTADRRRATGLLARGLVGALLGLVLVGCSDEEEPRPPASSSSTAPGLELRTKVTRVAGQLSPARRRAVEKQVGDLVRTYLEAAFVEGRSGTAAFPGFTPGARRLAAHDAGVLTAGRSATGGHASAFVSVFADHRRAQGATVRLVLRLDPEGKARAVPVTGRLLLTPARSGWRVFGYDVARGGHGEAAGS